MKKLLAFQMLLTFACAIASASDTTEKMQAVWDHQTKYAPTWTTSVALAINLYGSNLLDTVPKDMAGYCPKFKDLNIERRTAFWVNLISTLALQESSFKASSAFVEKFKDRLGNKVVSRGLLQLSFSDGAIYGCGFKSPQDLDDAGRNLECGVIIMNYLVGRDHLIAGKINGKYRGLARYWGPFRNDGDVVLFQMSSSQLDFCN